MESKIHKIAEFYDQENRNGYDNIYSSDVCHAEDHVLRRCLNPLVKGRRVLDVGCGTGLASFVCQEYGSYVGIDISAGELQEARRKTRRIPQVRGFLDADMNRLPFSERSFGALVCIYGPFSYSPEPDKLIEEFRRVVEDKGTIAFMPYSWRVGQGIGLGGYSTASETSIEKIFYTDNEVMRLCRQLRGGELRGINYLVNFALEDEEVMRAMQKGKVEGVQLVNLMCRHFRGNDLFTEPRCIEALKQLAGEWNRIRGIDRQNGKGCDTKVLTKMLQSEQRHLVGIIPAHFARHLLITGRK